jgi:hypothetical protein
MSQELAKTCAEHESRFACPDMLVEYVDKFDEYGLIVHDGGESFIAIAFCPWCGSALPESKRDEWFEELESRGIDPLGDQVPSKYKSDEWFRIKG